MKQILCPTDFSNNSYNAIYYASRLFENIICTFHIVNVYEKGNDFGIKEAEAMSIEGLDALCHRLVRDVGKNVRHSLKKVSLCSKVNEGVSSYAKEGKMDLMVIGNKGKDEAKDIWFGTDAMRLVREVTTCPILIVPLEIDYTPLKKIALICNYAKSMSMKNMETLQFFTSLAADGLVPMSFGDHKLDDFQIWHKAGLMKSLSINPKDEVKMPLLEGKAETILEFVDKWNIDMACMVYYPHHFILEFIGNGIVKELNTKLSIPFLILPHEPS